MDHLIEDRGRITDSVSCEDDVARVVLKVAARARAPVCVTKYLSYHYSGGAEPSEIRARTGWTLDRALEDGFVGLHERQKSHVQGFWERADVELEGGPDPGKQQTLRWNCSSCSRRRRAPRAAASGRAA